MNKLFAIFITIILVTIGSFALLWATNPTEEKDRVMATQGIRLVGSAVFYNAQNSTTPNKVKVGDLLIGSNERVYRINEIRKAQSNVIYVVVSWKYITKYSSYSEYVTQPYSNYATYELNSFAYNKSIITEPELSKFYEKYSKDLIVRNTKNIRKAPTSAAEPLGVAALPPSPVVQEISTTQDSAGIAPPESAPRNYLRASDVETQAYSTAEVSKPSDLDEIDQQKLKELPEAQN